MKIVCPNCSAHLGDDVKGRVYKCRHCREIFRVGDGQQPAGSNAGTVVESSSQGVSLPEDNNASPEAANGSSTPEIHEGTVIFFSKIMST